MASRRFVVEHKRCSICKERKSVSEFNRSACAPDGHRCDCKECRRIQSAKYYTKHKDKILSAVRLYKANHKEEYRIYGGRYRAKHREEIAKYEHVRKKTVKGRARTLLGSAVNHGNIIKPSHCSCCGREARGRALQGHHDDYTKPLDVRWLCSQCHSRAHCEPNSTSNARKGATCGK